MGKSYLVFLALIIILSVNFAWGEALPCSAIFSQLKLEELSATAAQWSNLRNSQGSLRYESKRLLLLAEKQLSTKQPPADLCPTNCNLPLKPQIIFQSTPKKFLQHYSEQDYCEKLLQKTEKSAFQYNNKTFKEMNQFADWFSSFSQGYGVEGKDLYSRCDSVCSPQYTSLISFANNTRSVDVSVICGEARDKDDNQYILTTSYLWKCQEKDLNK